VRRIVKTCLLSTVYKQWHDDLQAANQSHPEYKAKHKHYVDVVMNLLHCQGGLCAYTEVLLCAEDLCETGKWNEGRYQGDKPQHKGQLEHFDSTLKKDKGWLWANLFVVDSDINHEKGNKPVDAILKPDADDYDPFQRLEYSLSTHLFIPNSALAEDLRSRISEMIITLGLNHETVRQLRIQRFVPLLKAIKVGLESWDTVSLKEFPTAFAMIRNDLNPPMP
jgi:hypothetical protein